MGRPLRWIPPEEVVEITCRTIQGRALLRPGPEANRRIVGVLGRAQRRTGMVIHAITVLSNHYHLLASPRDADQLARFMGFVQANLSKELGALHGWEGPLWARRYRSIPVAADEESQVARLRYVLSNSVKENLVERCRDWPGVHSTGALVDGDELEGVWYDRSGFYEARRQARRRAEGKGESGESLEGPQLGDFSHRETVTLTPLPCWREVVDPDLASAERQAFERAAAQRSRRRVAELVESIEEEHAAQRRAEGVRVLGAAAVVAADPLARAPGGERPGGEWRSAPLVHAWTAPARRALAEAYGTFARSFAAAANEQRHGGRVIDFPEGSHPPGRPFVGHLGAEGPETAHPVAPPGATG